MVIYAQGELLEPSAPLMPRDRGGGDCEAGKRGVVEREHGQKL